MEAFREHSNVRSSDRFALRYPDHVLHIRPARDQELVQIVDAALVDATRKAGGWLACRPGCTQCCVGAFAINALDAARLRSGLIELQKTEPARADRLKRRARAYVQRVTALFPGDPNTGLLDDSESSQERFAVFADEEICPALDPEMGTCDLYQFRPMTCRVFGPPVRNEGGSLGICELCFHGATDQQIAACEMKPDPDNLEDKLLSEMELSGVHAQTVVAYVLAE
ncbi:MAG TPA: YkgJ family cysteine cluster protein [Terriglobales bacterium]|nr:YkgJ family cysteine cluster protein [Terriglobales bacterium]